MYKDTPSLVWFILLGLAGIELLLLVGFVSELYTSPLPVGELAIYVLLFVIIGLILLGAGWLLRSRRKQPSVPLSGAYDTDFPVHTPPTDPPNND